jgi:hypothetical protein
MSFRTCSSALALLMCAAVPASAQSVSLSFDNGTVSLSAQNAPVRLILSEWARLGGTQIVNGERVPGAPVTLELSGVSERQALDVLLRGASGYLIGARRESASGSTFDRILILPTSSAPFNPPPQPGFVAPPPPPPLPDFDDFPVDDPEIQRFRTPRDFVPPDGVPAPPMPPQPYQPDPDDPPADPANRPATQPGFPPMPTAERPGQIIPVPQPQPQIDDDP